MVRQHQVSLRGVVSTVVVTTLVLEVRTAAADCANLSYEVLSRQALRCHCELVWSGLSGCHPLHRCISSLMAATGLVLKAESGPADDGQAQRAVAGALLQPFERIFEKPVMMVLLCSCKAEHWQTLRMQATWPERIQRFATAFGSDREVFGRGLINAA